jgi:hypothetical protein
MYLHGSFAGMCFPPSEISSGEDVMQMTVAPSAIGSLAFGGGLSTSCRFKIGYEKALAVTGRGTIRPH